MFISLLYQFMFSVSVHWQSAVHGVCNSDLEVSGGIAGFCRWSHHSSCHLLLLDWRLHALGHLYYSQTPTQLGKDQFPAHRRLKWRCSCCRCQVICPNDEAAQSKDCSWSGWASDRALTKSLAGCQLAPFYAYWHFWKAKTTEVFEMEPRCIIFFL